jgi:phage terminase large subunit-like protein
MTPKQLEVLNSDSMITIFSAGRGCGKTASMALIAILNMIQGKRVLVIGPIFQQLKESNLFQTRRFLDRMKIPHKINKTDLHVNFGKTGEIMHVSGDEPESIRSYTSIDVLIFDEAASLSEDCWKLAIPTMRDTLDGKLKIYVVGTPPSSESHWMARLNKRKDVKTIFGSYKDNPFNGQDFVNLLEKDYENYPVDFQRRELYGEFIFGGEIGSLFEDFRIETNNEYKAHSDAPIVCGLDIAGKGRDMTCAVISQNNQVLGIYLRKTANEIPLKQFVKELYLMHGFEVLRYDEGGLGHLIVFDLPVTVLTVPVNFGGSGGERFANARTAMYFHLRRKGATFMHQEILKEHGEAMLIELKATQMKERESGKLGVIEKELIKKRIGRSPDRADALVLAMSHVEVKRSKPRIAPLVFGRR